MPQKREIEVDDPADFKELFDILCDEVMNMSPLDVRRGLLNFRGTDTAVLNNTIRANDIFKIIEKRDIKFTLKIDYASAVVIKTPAPPPPPVTPTFDLYAEMKAQKEVIPPHLIKDPVPVNIEPDKPYKPPAEDIPTFD